MDKKEAAKTMVHLEEHSAHWEAQYSHEKNKIMDIIGDEVDTIEHIGSTAVKDLKAKPINDIMVGIKELKLAPDLIDPLSEIGFEYVRKDEFPDRGFFRKGSWGNGTCHLHLVETKSTEWKEKLLFREYLRNYPDVANEYELLKSKLAAEYKNDRSSYTQKKEPFIQDIIKRAKRSIECF
ncbi:GrpB family protein [Alkalicoccus daliensis]|uniref:GrpB domain, predicted nucleotidyltransferase, UPF0157 family n=1 Tax=Alkalicoccus daliensis TaxID=745820 RepID=A0A1H0JXG9_9BACI|nr:GrpB family protein [Alkalicoccus daliensis]SDO48310.1 GrpB domain, predicted nucleotidyltransferase, UPF0157 family [Alkalicoccus daliensis]